jgi:hypothetical protein
MERPLAETSTKEFTAEALLAVAGEGIVSDRTLRRIRFGIAGVVPGVVVGLDTGIMFELEVGT